MKKFILISALLFGANSFSQLINTIPPTGQVGIGTNTPVMGKQLTVSGETIMLNSLEVNSDLIIDGLTKLNGLVRLNGINNYAGTIGDMEVVVTDPSGNVTKTLFTSLISATMEPALIDCGDVATPRWFHGLNKIYSPCPDVKVGIGNNNPKFKLDVSGTAYAAQLKLGNPEVVSYAMISAYSQEGSSDLVQIGKKVGGADAIINFLIKNDGSIIINNAGSNSAITINNGTGHAFVINNNAGEKILQVQDNGTLRSRHIIVNQDAWADYVFDKGYELMSLEETKIFILKNGHLPKIPSAKEVKAEGLDLAQMQLLQMEKIEEMYLHMMEMNDQINTLQNQVIDLRSENEQLKDK